MDPMLVKSEFNGNGRRPICEETALLGGGSGYQAKCIKRRRREPRLPAVLVRGNDGEAVLDPSPTSGSTVKRSSRFRGVSRHRWTGRYEAHLWDKGSWNATQRKKGKQVYLGAYTEEESAARAYDLAALKYWGPSTFTNFPVSEYEDEIQIMQNMTKEEYLASLRRKSSGFSRGVSKYRGVARHHHNGRWEARIGRVFGNKYLYLGTYSTQEEAAHAYDIAAIEYRGINAVTNFNLSTYIRWLRPGASSNTIKSIQERHNNMELQAMQPTHNPCVNNADQDLFFHCNAHFANDVDSVCKQEFSPQVMLNSPRNKSSPTALSLLLRSSVFRELMEKNSAGYDEALADKEAVKYWTPQSGSDVDLHRIYYNRTMDVPEVCPSDIGEHGESSSDLLDGMDPCMWNAHVLGMPGID